MDSSQMIYRAMIDNLILDSLKRPLRKGDLPDYPIEDSKSKEYIRVRTQRKRLNEEEYWRSNARFELMEPYAEYLYLFAYGEHMDRVHELLRIAWSEIDSNPDTADKYTEIYRRLTQYQNMDLEADDE